MEAGKYLSSRDRKRLEWERQRSKRLRIRKKAQLLLALGGGNAVLVYLIAGGLLDGTWGAGLTAALSACLGYQLKGAWK